MFFIHSSRKKKENKNWWNNDERWIMCGLIKCLNLKMKRILALRLFFLIITNEELFSFFFFTFSSRRVESSRIESNCDTNVMKESERQIYVTMVVKDVWAFSGLMVICCLCVCVKCKHLSTHLVTTCFWVGAASTWTSATATEQWNLSCVIFSHFRINQRNQVSASLRCSFVVLLLYFLNSDQSK